MKRRAQLRILTTRRPWFLVISGVTLAAMVGWPIVDFLLLRVHDIGNWFNFHDFGAYFLAARRWLTGVSVFAEVNPGVHLNIYPPDIFGFPYLYPPVFAALFAPFTSLPFAVAKWVFVGGSALALGASICWLLSVYGLDLRWYEYGLVILAVIGFQPVYQALKLGQITVLLAACFAVAAGAIERARQLEGQAARRWSVLAGFLTAIPGTVKTFYAVAGAHTFRDRWRFVGAISAGCIVAIASVAAVGPAEAAEYFAVLAEGKGWTTTFEPVNWRPGYYEPLYGLGVAGLAIRGALVVGLIAIGVFVARRARGPSDDDVTADRALFALGIAAIPIAGPETYALEFCTTLVAAIVLVRVEFDVSGWPALPMLAILLMHGQGHTMYILATYIPANVPNTEWLIDLSPALQPGLWANLFLLYSQQ